MTKLDKTAWVTSTYDAMEAQVSSILRAAGLGLTGQRYDHYVTFSVFETIQDAVKDDMSDWLVRHPDLTSRFAEGKVQFDLGDDEQGHAVLSKGYLNPTWADVLVEAERSCIGRGAPELDHIFLEGLEREGTGADGAAFWAFRWGS